jgi:hypothetical protein
MAGSVQKTCCICGADVGGTKRVRDPRGNYYCNPCYYARLEEYERRRVAEQQASASRARLLAEAEAAEQRRRAQTAVAVAMATRAAIQPRAGDGASSNLVSDSTCRSGWAGIMAWLGGRAAGDSHQHVDVSGAMGGEYSHQPEQQYQEQGAQHVEVHRRGGRRASRRVVRVSDLLGPEAMAEVEAAREDTRAAEPDVPASPIVNPPASTILAEYAQEQGAYDEELMRVGRAMG